MKGDARTPRVVDVMRVAVQQAEESSGVPSDDPAIVELRLNMVRTVGELELAKAKRQDHDEEPP